MRWDFFLNGLSHLIKEKIEHFKLFHDLIIIIVSYVFKSRKNISKKNHETKNISHNHIHIYCDKLSNSKQNHCNLICLRFFHPNLQTNLVTNNVFFQNVECANPFQMTLSNVLSNGKIRLKNPHL